MIDSKVVNTINPNRTEFPKLMISTGGMIVLFESKTSGAVVMEGSGHRIIGEYSKTWNLNLFTNFNGKVELSNV